MKRRYCLLGLNATLVMAIVAVGVPAAGAAPAVGGRSVSAAAVGALPGSGTVSVPRLPVVAATVRAQAAGGDLLHFGSARNEGSLLGRPVNAPIVAMAATPDGKGYWLAGSDGGIFTFGDAHFYGSTGAITLNRPIVGMAATPDGKGYWLAGSDGGIFTFGDAHFYGSTGAITLNRPIVGMAATPDGKGYWLAGSDGGIFTFGDAHFYGSTGAITLNRPIVGMAATPDGKGYWLAGSDGGIFTFGDAHFYGSTGAITLNRPIVGMAATPDGKGYWLAGSDGGIFTFGDARFYGSGAAQPMAEPAAAIVAAPGGGGYWLVESESPSPDADIFSPALVGALSGRAGDISAAVLDLNSGHLYQYRPGQEGITASIVKVEILGTLLSESQVTHSPLTAQEQALSTSMIDVSDNSAATALWDEVGQAPAVAGFDRAAGMVATVPNPAWGLTVTTAADQVTLLDHLAQPNSLLSAASRAYALHLMESVTPSQAWGVSAGPVPGTTVALKNGWLPVGSGWTDNSIGWVDGSGRDYLVAVLTDSDPNEDYGIASISMIAQAAWAALGPQI